MCNGGEVQGFFDATGLALVAGNGTRSLVGVSLACSCKLLMRPANVHLVLHVKVGLLCKKRATRRQGGDAK